MCWAEPRRQPRVAYGSGFDLGKPPSWLLAQAWLLQGCKPHFLTLSRKPPTKMTSSELVTTPHIKILLSPVQQYKDMVFRLFSSPPAHLIQLCLCLPNLSTKYGSQQSSLIMMLSLFWHIAGLLIPQAWFKCHPPLPPSLCHRQRQQTLMHHHYLILHLKPRPRGLIPHLYTPMMTPTTPMLQMMPPRPKSRRRPLVNMSGCKMKSQSFWSMTLMTYKMSSWTRLKQQQTSRSFFHP